MEAVRISTILNWSKPDSVCEVQTFLGFANFYRQFVNGFSQNSTPTHGYRGNAEIKKRSSLAEERFLDAGGFGILSIVGSFFHQLTVPCLLWCKASNKARNTRFKLFNLKNLISKKTDRVERCSLLPTQNDWRREKLQGPWCWTFCYCWEFPLFASLPRATVSHCENTHRS